MHDSRAPGKKLVRAKEEGVWLKVRSEGRERREERKGEEEEEAAATCSRHLAAVFSDGRFLMRLILASAEHVWTATSSRLPSVHSLSRI